MKKEQEYFTLKEAAAYIGISEGCMRNIKHLKGYEYLPYEKIFGRVRYKKEIVENFVKNNIRGETEEEKAKLKLSNHDKLDKVLCDINTIKNHQLAIARHLGLQDKIMREKEAEVAKLKILAAYGNRNEHTSS